VHLKSPSEVYLSDYSMAMADEARVTMICIDIGMTGSGMFLPCLIYHQTFFTSKADQYSQRLVGGTTVVQEFGSGSLSSMERKYLQHSPMTPATKPLHQWHGEKHALIFRRVRI
jgi:hypothetical protein